MTTPGLATRVPQTVAAKLTDGASGDPIAGRSVTFTIGSLSASALTDSSGVATATMTLPGSSLGQGMLTASFAGDSYLLPSEARVTVVLYEPTSFVVWGGNQTGPTGPAGPTGAGGLALGAHVTFWGSQSARSVTGGDYHAASDFKGYAGLATSPAAPCEQDRSTASSPALDEACWTARPGASSSPPATLGSFIGVAVSTSIAEHGSTVYGNIAATAVVRVEPGSSYSPNPGHPGVGTIVAVIDDPGGLLGSAAASGKAGASASGTAGNERASGGTGMVTSMPNSATSGASSSPQQSALSDKAAISSGRASASSGTGAVSFTSPAVAAGEHRYFLYTPELHLMAETELTSAPHPIVDDEYIWFDGMPVAQQSSTGETRWTFTDHLGTPILQTSSLQGIVWRAEYEPYGRIFELRAQDVHQPLRLPGQEAEQLNAGANGATDRSYNIHRWYESGVGRYAEPDPLAVNWFNIDPLQPALHLPPGTLERTRSLIARSAQRGEYGYGVADPERWMDPLGLSVCDSLGSSRPGCLEPGSHCCIAACIHEARVALCRLEHTFRWMKVTVGGVGAVLGFAGAAGAGLEFGPGAVACGVAGGAMGYSGAESLGLEHLTGYKAARELFGECMHNTCGHTCSPGKPCLTQNLWNSVVHDVTDH